jgi:hypothetical protein
VTAGRRERTAIAAANAVGTVTVAQLLDGHVRLDLECLDRTDLNGYAPNLQVGGQVVTFLVEHLGNPIPRRRCSTRSGSGPVLGWPALPPSAASRWCGSARPSARPRSCGRI